MVEDSIKTFGQKYERPTQVRDIPRKAGSERGSVISTKPKLRKEGITFSHESNPEKYCYILFDHDPGCIDLVPQPAEIPWTNTKGKVKPTYPDCWTKWETGEQILFEVKPEEVLRELEKDEDWHLKVKAIKECCVEKGWEYRIITDREIYTTRLDNVLSLLRSAKTPPPKDRLTKIREALKAIFKNADALPREDLALELCLALPAEIEEANEILDYFIYRCYFDVDWDSPLTSETLLRPLEDDQGIPPAYIARKKPRVILEDLNSKEIYNRTPGDKRDLDSLPEGVLEKAKEKFEIIRPLLELKREGKQTEKDVIQRSAEFGVSSRTLYKWMELYLAAGGLRGLFPKTHLKGCGSKLDEAAEEEINKSINGDYMKGMSHMKSCWETMVGEWDISGVDPPSYETYRQRVGKIEVSEYKGTQGINIRHAIPRSLTGGGIPIGKRPLELVLFDHCNVDIVLVDQEHRMPVGRPWLTVGVDYCTKDIYGFFLSFDDPGQVSVGGAMLNGIKPKNEVLARAREYYDIESDWETCGLSDFTQSDNAWEFEANAIQNFCQLYGINFSFRPVKRPDLGGRVERIFRTINERICDEGLGGYAPPLKKRPPGYNPNDTAIMTLPEFEAWLVHFIVETYRKRPHGEMETIPAECYQEGMKGRRPRLPEDLERMRYDILPSKTVSVQTYGVKFERLNYYHPILGQVRRSELGKKKEVVIRYDPRDIRWVYYFHSPENKYYSIPVRGGVMKDLVLNRYDTEEITGDPISLSEFKKVKKDQREKKRNMNPTRLGKKVQERKRKVAQQSKDSRRARMESERKRHHKKIVPQHSPPDFGEEDIPGWEDFKVNELREIDVIHG